MTRLVTCSWCGSEIPLGEHEHDCDPHCQICGEEYESKATAHEHDCPEKSGVTPTEDRTPESERIAQRERQRWEDARAREKRLGLDRLRGGKR